MKQYKNLNLDKLLKELLAAYTILVAIYSFSSFLKLKNSSSIVESVGNLKGCLSNGGNSLKVEPKIASWRSLGITVPEMKDREMTLAAILRESRVAIEEDAAECVVLGRETMVGQAKKVQEELGVPVLDPILMGLKVAELRAMLWKRFGISHSEIGGYEAPPLEEFRSIYEKFYN